MGGQAYGSGTRQATAPPEDAMVKYNAPTNLGIGPVLDNKGIFAAVNSNPFNGTTSSIKRGRSGSFATPGGKDPKQFKSDPDRMHGDDD